MAVFETNYTLSDFNDFGSHIPILESLFNTFPIKRVIEFGMGSFSTNFFLKQHPDLLVSVEYDKDWFEKTRTDQPKHICIREEPHLFTDHLKLADWWDLAFVDGPGIERVNCMRASLDKARFIAIHDRRVYREGRDDYGYGLTSEGWYEIEYWCAHSPSRDKWFCGKSELPYDAPRDYPLDCMFLAVTGIMSSDHSAREKLSSLFERRACSKSIGGN